MNKMFLWLAALAAMFLLLLCPAPSCAQGTTRATAAQGPSVSSEAAAGYNLQQAIDAQLAKVREAVNQEDEGRIIVLLSRSKGYPKIGGGLVLVNLHIDPFYRGRDRQGMPLVRALIIEKRQGTYQRYPKQLVADLSRPEGIVFMHRVITSAPATVKSTAAGPVTVTRHQDIQVRTDEKAADIWNPSIRDRKPYEIRSWQHRTAYWDKESQKAYVLGQFSQRVVKNDGSVSLRAGLQPVYDEATTLAFRSGVKGYQVVGGGYYNAAGRWVIQGTNGMAPGA